MPLAKDGVDHLGAQGTCSPRPGGLALRYVRAVGRATGSVAAVPQESVGGQRSTRKPAWHRPCRIGHRPMTASYVLGISAFYHDSAACLLRDGEIAAAAQEE